ncbi:MAG: prepilin-type N-terminal cleavage/methylation domain-containing protein [Candidatus Brocadiaceae bacterium]|nr:prepilin-type N-terminal cleavage/methylation domain-containing protein [Candidatus Brocadiaceae bacterium]
MRRQAFTLMELLVVISIITILAGMLMPAAGRAMNQARAVSCRSRLRQIGAAVQLYAVNHAGYLPGCADSDGRQFFGKFTGASEQVDFTAGYLSFYVGEDPDIWQCPSTSHGSFMPRAEGPCTGYGYNYYYLTELKEKGDWWDPDYAYSWQGKHESAIYKFSTTILFADSARDWMGPLEENWFLDPTSQCLAWPGWESLYVHFRHGGRCNVLWADGHVTSMPPDEDTWPVNGNNLGVLCDSEDIYFHPEK